MRIIKVTSKLKWVLMEMLWLAIFPIAAANHEAFGAEQAKSRTEFEFLFQRHNSLAEFEEKFFRMENIRKNAEQALLQLLAHKKHDLELALRLAELHLQKARDVEHYSLELEFAGQSAKAIEQKKLFRSLSEKGLKLHERLLKNNGTHPLVSEIYLGMARTRFSLGDKTGALGDAIEGIKKFKSKSSKVLLNLWIVRGDASFALSRPADALQAYENAKGLADKGGEDSAYIIYKLAWTYYNLKDPTQALALLDELLLRTEDKLSLRKEAVQDYSLFMVDLEPSELKKRGGIEGVYSLLSRVAGPANVARAFESLGKNYFKNGHRTLALEAYELLLKQNAVDPKNIDRALLVIEWTQSLANKWELTEKYQWLLKEFGPTSAWYAAQIHRPEIQKTSYDRIESSLRKYSMSLHQEATRENVLEVRRKREEIVAKLYDAYLASFSEEARIYYYRAEIFRVREEWNSAGTHYDRFLVLSSNAIENKKNETDEKLKDEAAWGSVQVWSQAIEKDPKYVEQYLKSSDFFVENFPKHPSAPQVALGAAKVELKMKRSAVALRRIENLYKKFPKTSQASQGVHAALDILNQEKDYVNLALKTRLFLNNIQSWALPSEVTKLKSELTEILSKTEAKACESLSQTKGNEFEAALCFENFAKDFHKDPLAPKALLMASDLYSSTERYDAALVSLEKLVKNYPNSPQAVEAFSKLALTYEKNFEFAKAADIFEILLRKNTQLNEKEKIAARLLSLLEGLGEEARLEKLLSESFVKASSKRDFFERRALRVLGTLEKAFYSGAYDKGQFKEATLHKNFKDLDKNQGVISLEALLRFARLKGLLLRSENKLDQADQVWMSALKLYWKSGDKKNPRILEAAARLRLEQASLWETQFKRTDFQKQGARKTELYGKLENWYSEVVGFKSPSVALEALLRSAKLAFEFSEELKAGLSRAPASDKATLEQVIQDLKSKGEMLVEQVKQRAKAWKVLTPAVVEALSLQSAPQMVQSQSSRDIPWGALTLWVDLEKDHYEWSEWSRSDASLMSQMKDRSSRSGAKKAAFVLLSRENSLSKAELKSWSLLMTDRAGVQLRIQSLINDGSLRMAQLFIDQYAEIFGEDLFISFANGLLSWAEGNSEEAFRYWMNTAKKDDFRLAFLRMAWSHGLDQGKLELKDFEILKNLSEKTWHKHLLAKVCFEYLSDCPQAAQWDEVLMQPAEAPFERDFMASAFDYRYKGLVSSIKQGLEGAKSLDQLQHHFSRVNPFYNLKNFATEHRTQQIKKQVSEFQALAEKKSLEIRSQKTRVVAGAAVGAVEGGSK